MRCFIFRELDDAKNLVTDYLKLMQANEGHGRIVHLATAYNYFYSGMIAWHFFRETLDRYWINIGNDAIEKMRSWSSQCSWNFSNKLLLLQAESHYSLGEEKLAGASVLIFANKRDIAGAMDLGAMSSRLGLDKLVNRHWKIVGCSAVTGDGLLDGFDWLVNDCAGRIYMMS